MSNIKSAYIYALRPGVWDEVLIAALIGHGAKIVRLQPRNSPAGEQ